MAKDFATAMFRDLGGRVRYEDRARVMNGDSSRARWTAFASVLGHDAIGAGATRRAAFAAALAELPEHMHRYFVPPTWHLVVNGEGTVLGVWGSALLSAAENQRDKLCSLVPGGARIVTVRGERPHVGQVVGS